MDDKKRELLALIGAPLLEDLEAGGLTRTKLIEKLGEELEATEIKPFNYNGTIIYSKPLPNWEIRQKARIDIQKLCAFYPPEKYQLQVPRWENLPDEELEKRINEFLDGRKSEQVKAIDYQAPQGGEKEEPHE